MTSENLSRKTKQELARLAKKQGVPGYHAMRKAELIRALGRRLSVAKSARKRELTASLAAKTREELRLLAKENKIAGWHTLRKCEIVDALVRVMSDSNTRSGNGKDRPAAVPSPAPAAARRTNGNGSSIQDHVECSKYDVGHAEVTERRLQRKLPGGYAKDRIVAMVRDPYWLHVYWELTRQSIERTEATLGQQWYSAKPILRLMGVDSSEAPGVSESVIRDIPIHGGVNNWYIDVDDPPHSYRVDIGFLSAKGRFITLARSNVVRTPEAGMSDQLDEHWLSVKRDSERVFAMSGGHDPNAGNEELKKLFEERLRRPMSHGSLSSYGSGALGEGHRRGFHFEIDAELIVYGTTNPGATVMLQNEPVQTRDDGSFTLRFGLPEGRQIIPAVATTGNGIEERTIILAIERNTKLLDPLVHDGQE